MRNGPIASMQMRGRNGMWTGLGAMPPKAARAMEVKMSSAS